MSKDKSLTKNQFGADRKLVQVLRVDGIIAQLPLAVREKMLSNYDMKRFARIFEDEDMMSTVDSFLSHGMNVSATARGLYMHRNTLTYRLNKIKAETGLDLREFDKAVTFEMLRALYKTK